MARHIGSILCLVALFVAAIPAASAQDTAPELALKDLSGTEQKLADYKGKVIILNFWATWCAPCRKEMPSLVKLQADYGSKGVQVVAVTVDTDSFHDKVVQYAADSKLNFPVWFGSTANMEAFDLGVLLPSTVFIDQQGHIVGRVEGIIDEAAVRTQLDALLSKRS
jgi:thiol-disulfide isomerase/thioredoxin